MSAEAHCDGCGKSAPMWANALGQWFKPRDWFQRSDSAGIQIACSRECIKIVAVTTGKTDVVLPI